MTRTVVQMRVGDIQKVQWEQAARKCGLEFSAWARAALDKQAKIDIFEEARDVTVQELMARPGTPPAPPAKLQPPSEDGICFQCKRNLRVGKPRIANCKECR